VLGNDEMERFAHEMLVNPVRGLPFLENDLRLALLRDEDDPLVPTELRARAQAGSIELRKIGERVFPDLVARAYELLHDGKEPAGIQCLVTNTVGEVTYAFVGYALAKHLGLESQWDISGVIVRKLAFFGFDANVFASEPGKMVRFTMSSSRWNAMDEIQRRLAVCRARQLAWDRKRVLYGTVEPILVKVQHSDAGPLRVHEDGVVIYEGFVP
jgi:hypothetical protein